MVSKIVVAQDKTFSNELNATKTSQLKPVKKTHLVEDKQESLFPKSPRQMVWKKINGKLVAEWI